jgi:hypothetical protein
MLSFLLSSRGSDGLDREWTKAALLLQHHYRSPPCSRRNGRSVPYRAAHSLIERVIAQLSLCSYLVQNYLIVL